MRRHELRTFVFKKGVQRRIAVVSDTHGKPHQSLFSIIEQHHPALTLHAGDIGDPAMIEELESYSPTIFVRGNIDPSGPQWPDSIDLRIGLDEGKTVNLILIHAALAGLRLSKQASVLLRKSPARVMIFGHSHIPFLGCIGGVTAFNPGSAGPARPGLPATCGLLEISPSGLCFKHIDLQTGRQWRPELNR